eukprot:scaffold7213_cov118-Isochrysis_galbana.AAC.7
MAAADHLARGGEGGGGQRAVRVESGQTSSSGGGCGVGTKRVRAGSGGVETTPDRTPQRGLTLSSAPPCLNDSTATTEHLDFPKPPMLMRSGVGCSTRCNLLPLPTSPARSRHKRDGRCPLLLPAGSGLLSARGRWRLTAQARGRLPLARVWRGYLSWKAPPPCPDQPAPAPKAPGG